IDCDKMAMKNDSTVTEFILAGLTDQPELQLPLFILFLVYHTVTVVGNLSLMSLIFLNSDLQTPMYFFLFNLSFIDLCYSFVFTPKTLMSFVSEKNTISYRGCMTQLFFFCFFAHSECYVLTAMAYDRYVAICQPLLYMVIMSPRTCSLMMFGSYFMGLAGATVHTVFMVRLNFCDSNIINHYLCDIFPLLQLSCSSTYASELVSSVVVSTVVIASSVVILMSYVLIFLNITQLSSGKGLYKAMSTCSSHIITVALFYGFGMLSHIKTSSDESVVQEKILSVFYTFLLPLLNPFIYSLRNQDVKVTCVSQMIMENDSSVSEFFLMGLTEEPHLQLPLFVLFLVNYTATVKRNLSLMNFIFLDSNLHTPCIILSSVSFLLISIISFVFTPKNANKFSFREEHYLLQMMHDSAVFLLLVCELRELCVDSHGLRSLFGHLSVTVVQGYYVTGDMFYADI
ncbi:hypothetical protein U0070_014715, partial [Myodes glareolus]